MRPRPTRATHLPYTTLFRSRTEDEPTESVRRDRRRRRRHDEGGIVIRDRRQAEPAKRQHGQRNADQRRGERDRKSTRLNSSHANISYAVYCLKKKNNTRTTN